MYICTIELITLYSLYSCPVQCLLDLRNWSQSCFSSDTQTTLPSETAGNALESPSPAENLKTGMEQG